jgi:hypothetical protein
VHKVQRRAQRGITADNAWTRASTGGVKLFIQPLLFPWITHTNGLFSQKI